MSFVPTRISWRHASDLHQRNHSAALQLHPATAQRIVGNAIQYAPHPNPPRLLLSPSCFAPLVQGEEPTFGDQNRDGNFATNSLVTGDPFGVLGGKGPSGLLTRSTTYTGVNFYGPAPSAQFCPTFTLRQQVGHFLYVVDTLGERIIVLNSNRMTVLDSIPVSDPVDLAMAPDMNTLAVSNRGTSTITLIDTNPYSQNFHTVIKQVPLIDEVDNRRGRGPGEVVWQPDDEDILVVCELTNSVAFVSTADFKVRKIIPGVSQPRLVSVTNRDIAKGFLTGLYYAYVVSQDGRMSVFESGPDGPQGIGYDDFIGQVQVDGQSGFPSAAALQPNPNSPTHGVYVGYRLGGDGAVSEVFLKSSPTGPRSPRRSSSRSASASTRTSRRSSRTTTSPSSSTPSRASTRSCSTWRATCGATSRWGTSSRRWSPARSARRRCRTR